METSRDDFIIAIRSALLQKGNKQRFSLVGLIFFSIVILILGKFNFKAIDYLKTSIKETVYLSSFIVSAPENSIFKFYTNIKSHFNIYEKYINTKTELEKLKAQKSIDSFIVIENKKLKKLVDDYFIESDKIIAKALIDKNSPFLRSIIINKGSKNHIKLGMIVLDKSYLVGKIVEVNYTTSRVLLLSDLNSKIPVIIEPGSIQSILSGTGKNFGVLQYLEEKYLIENKSVVYTSGSGGLFKPGIPIGVINFNEIEDKYIINFFSDSTQLEFVEIQSFNKKEY
ncbi:rod shape-determining protein MreC [Pelagibacteraceae bacterium]|nr:rod shape-determining protein MreC [Pelagibacteraceae bacterium]